MPDHRILLSKSISSNDVHIYKNSNDSNRRLKTIKNADGTKKSSIRRHTLNDFRNIKTQSIHFPLPTITEHIQSERRSWCCNIPLSQWNESTNNILDSPSSPDICPKKPQRSSSITEFIDDIDLI